MNIITAKELRDNLGEITKRVKAGEHIKVSYRNNIAFKLEPLVEKVENPKGMPGLDSLIKAPRKSSTYDQNKSYKNLYHEMLDEKYGKK